MFLEKVSETRWPEEDDYKSDGFRIILSGGEESQRGVAIIIIDKITANCVERSGVRVTHCSIHPSMYLLAIDYC